MGVIGPGPGRGAPIVLREQGGARGQKPAWGWRGRDGAGEHTRAELGRRRENQVAGCWEGARKGRAGAGRPPRPEQGGRGLLSAL